MKHDTDHERVMTGILAGDLSRDGAEARQLLSDCAICRRELAELQVLSLDLGAAGAEQRAILARSKARDPSHEGLVRSWVQRELGASAASPRGLERRRGWWWILALSVAAAAAVVVVLSRPRHEASGSGTPGSPEEGILLGEGLTCLAPRSAVLDFEAFRWSDEGLPPGGHYELRIWGSTADGREELLVTELELHETEWLPPAALDRGVERLRWSIELWDATGLVDATEAEAWLVPR